MKTFPFIKIENTNYPTVIMGEDNFTGWFGKGNFNSEKERANAYKETIETAYSFGIRGFSISPHQTLIKVLKQFKKKHPEIVCISNHHWQTHYYIGKELLWAKENLERLGATEKSILNKNLIKDCYWFKDIDIEKRFSKKEINSFKLNVDEYVQQLKEFRKFCDFCLVGNLGRSALILLGREDIIRKETELARGAGLIPIGMCEGGGVILPRIEKLDVAGTWVWINSVFACPNLDYALDVIKKSKKPITAYKIFAGPEVIDLDKSINFIKGISQIKSIVVGVENKVQAKETFRRLRELYLLN